MDPLGLAAVGVAAAALAVALARRGSYGREAELLKRIAELEKRLAEKDAECYQKMQRLCGLERDAAALLDALQRGDVVVTCREGAPAAIIGGRLICLHQQSS